MSKPTYFYYIKKVEIYVYLLILVGPLADMAVRKAPTCDDANFHGLLEKVEALLEVKGRNAPVVDLLTSAARLLNESGRVPKRPKLSVNTVSAPAPIWSSCGISPSPTQQAFLANARLLQEANAPPNTDSVSDNTRSKTRKRHL